MNIFAIIPARLDFHPITPQSACRYSRKADGVAHLAAGSTGSGFGSGAGRHNSIEVYNTVESWGGKAIMTSTDCRSGTERVSSIIDRVDADCVLNVQGDEPLIDPKMLENLVASWSVVGGDLITPVFQIQTQSDLFNPNIVKVVRGLDGRALYFSRSPIPFVRDIPPERWLELQVFWGHIGVYGYRKEVLMRYPSLPESPLEMAEKLEQLRFLDAGYRIQTTETNYRSVAVDTFADLEHVRLIFGQSG